MRIGPTFRGVTERPARPGPSSEASPLSGILLASVRITAPLQANAVLTAGSHGRVKSNAGIVSLSLLPSLSLSLSPSPSFPPFLSLSLFLSLSAFFYLSLSPFSFFASLCFSLCLFLNIHPSIHPSINRFSSLPGLPLSPFLTYPLSRACYHSQATRPPSAAFHRQRVNLSLAPLNDFECVVGE